MRNNQQSKYSRDIKGVQESNHGVLSSVNNISMLLTIQMPNDALSKIGYNYFGRMSEFGRRSQEKRGIFI